MTKIDVTTELRLLIEKYGIKSVEKALKTEKYNRFARNKLENIRDFSQKMYFPTCIKNIVDNMSLKYDGDTYTINFTDNVRIEMNLNYVGNLPYPKLKISANDIEKYCDRKGFIYFTTFNEMMMNGLNIDEADSEVFIKFLWSMLIVHFSSYGPIDLWDEYYKKYDWYKNLMENPDFNYRDEFDHDYEDEDEY